MISNNNTVSGSLVVYLFAEDNNMLDNGKVQLELLEKQEFVDVLQFGNAILIDLTFKGDAVLHAQFENCAHKQIELKRFHSIPFPNTGGFCISSEIKPEGARYALLPEKINIYSADYLEHIKVDENGCYLTSSVHNLNKSLVNF